MCDEEQGVGGVTVDDHAEILLRLIVPVLEETELCVIERRLRARVHAAVRCGLHHSQPAFEVAGEANDVEDPGERSRDLGDEVGEEPEAQLCVDGQVGTRGGFFEKTVPLASVPDPAQDAAVALIGEAAVAIDAAQVELGG